jgi:hypothetical protein
MNPLKGLHYALASFHSRRARAFNRANHPATLPADAHAAALEAKSLDGQIAFTKETLLQDQVMIAEIEGLALRLFRSDAKTRERSLAIQQLEGAALWLRKEIGDVPPPNFSQSGSNDGETPKNTPSPGLAGVSEAGSPPSAPDEPPVPISNDQGGNSEG